MKRICFVMAVGWAALAMGTGAWAQGEWKSVTETNQVFEEGYRVLCGGP